VKKDAGVMWYFWPDLAFDLVKGLVAGGASLALQAVAPVTLRALKQLRARWSARKAKRKAGRDTSGKMKVRETIASNRPAGAPPGGPPRR
jgi:hypothetical protein